MAKLFLVLLSLALVSSALAAALTTTPAPWNRKYWRPTEFFRDPYPYSDGPYIHRDYYNNRKYFDDYFGRFRPNAVAAADASITRMDSVPLQPDGTYEYAYETENGISMQERALPSSFGKHGKSDVVEGSYAYTSPEGLRVLVRYTADENGFHPFISYGGPGASILSNNVQPADVAVSKTN